MFTINEFFKVFQYSNEIEFFKIIKYEIPDKSYIINNKFDYGEDDKLVNLYGNRKINNIILLKNENNNKFYIIFEID